MSLLTIPNELLLQIARSLLRCPTCHCHHISWDLSALSRSNHQLHALLADYLLTTASPLQMLLWAIANSRHDIVTLALKRGADPNSPLRPNPYLRIRAAPPISPPIDIAIRMRVHSANPELHARKLGIVALLLAVGGICSTTSLNMCARYGDLDLLELCLQYMPPIDMFSTASLFILLMSVAAQGHVEATRMVIGAGASVNSANTYRSMGYFPVLYVCWYAPLAVLEVLLEAGANPTWRDHTNISIVQNMRAQSIPSPELEDKIALLIRYGAVDEQPTWQVIERGTRRGHWNAIEYRGWKPDPVSLTDGPVSGAVLAGLYGGCECLTCPQSVTIGAYSSRGYEARGGRSFDVWSAEAVERINAESAAAMEISNTRTEIV